MAVEDALELLVEALNGQRTQLMENAAHFDAVARVRIGTVVRGHQDLPGLVTALLNVRRSVVQIAQYEAGVSTYFPLPLKRGWAGGR